MVNKVSTTEYRRELSGLGACVMGELATLGISILAAGVIAGLVFYLLRYLPGTEHWGS